MAQPLLGLVSAALTMAVAIGFISLFELPTFAGWVAFIALCFIPMEIVAGIIWGANPPFAERLRQPLKGLALMMTTVLAAAVIAPLVLWIVGEGVGPPGPIPSHFAVIAVVFTFWLSIMMGGWPFTAAIPNRVAAGIAVLAASYLVTWVVFRVFFDYAFLRGTPVYLESAPTGLYNAVVALVFCVTHVAAMFVVLCFDLWPFTKSATVMRQPTLGIVWTAVALGLTAAATWLGIAAAGLDPMVFLTRVTVPFIFGSIMVLNMFENSLFASQRQPVKGVLNVVAAAVIGSALAWLYATLAPAVSGPLSSGPPAYDLEVWLANALLGITFPLLVFHAVFFNFFPLRKAVPGSRP